ncbi:hypothetical protein ACHAWF_018792 [Thalassiosira exigua]
MSERAASASSDGATKKEFVLNANGSILVDHKGAPVAVDRFLCTKPLRSEVSTRKGPGGIKLSYMGGDMVTKTLNEAFGYDGWCLEVKETRREEPIKDDKGRFHVAYLATVRITHRRSGVFRGKIPRSCKVFSVQLFFRHKRLLSTIQEDCGAGDSIDRSLASASGNALKGAVTDAMKRAARHFGEKLGNSLYHDGFNANNAPPTLKDALDSLDIDRAKSRFGFEKDKKVAGPSGQTSAYGTSTASTAVKKETSSNATTSAQPSYAQQTPRTQYVGKVVMEHPTKLAGGGTSKPSHVTPHHTGDNSSHRPATSAATQNPAQPANTYITRGGQAFTNSGKENSNPQNHPPNTGLALPQRRPGTSRGTPPALPSTDNSPTSAYIANFPENGTPSMFGANGQMSQALVAGQGQTNITQSLKRKSDSLCGPVTGAKPANTGTRNPYHC